MTGKTGKSGKNSGSGTIVVRRLPGAAHRAILRFGPLAFRASIGRNGTTARKREGDGSTPIAAMPLLYGYRAGRPASWPRSPLRLMRAEYRPVWCDDPASPNYNRPARLPLSASFEHLRRSDGIYDVVVVLDWNMRRRVRHRGSAIFFHLARADFGPTAGCVAVDRKAMRILLPHLRKGVRIAVPG